MSIQNQSRQRSHRGHIRHNPVWISCEARERHQRFALAAGEDEQTYTHPILKLANQIGSEDLKTGSVQDAVKSFRVIEIPGTLVRLMFWETASGSILVLKQDRSHKPGCIVFVTPYPGQLSFIQLVDKYESLAQSYSHRLSQIDEKDLQAAA